jgi:hypothetical protein
MHETRSLKRPVGPVVARFRSFTLEWIDGDPRPQAHGPLARSGRAALEQDRLGPMAHSRTPVERPRRTAGDRSEVPGEGTLPIPSPAPMREALLARASPGTHPSGDRKLL